MAVLSEADRQRVWRAFMRLNSEPVGFTKAQLFAAVGDTDQWIEDNASDFNAALPAAFRNGASLQQKTLLFCWVAMRRAGLLSVEGE